ncbi:MAG: DUF4388 domain-containing protein [candidate division Zixibacteria bacterium]|nr:DUF4388 domain-containing protein [candidate division Zixibacteria bacterium]
MENHDLSAMSMSFFLSQPDQENADHFIQRPTVPRTFPEIDLANTHIGETVRRTFPEDMLRRLRVVPFDFDPNGQILKVACADPFDPRLVQELTAGLYNVAVELYAARPDAIDRVIADLTVESDQPDTHPEQPPAPPDDLFDDAMFGTLVDDPVPVDDIIEECPAESMPCPQTSRRSVLFVTPGGRISDRLRSLFQAEQVSVTIVNDIAAAKSHLQSESADTVFIDETLRGANDAVRPLYRHASETSIRYYRSEAEILTNNTVDDFAEELMSRNLAVIGHMYGQPEKPLHAHARIATQLVESLGRYFDLSSNLRLALATAASFHNLAESHLKLTDIYSQVEIIGLSAGRLASWDYPPLVIRLLRRMYDEEAGISGQALEPEALAGQILTAVDIYCHAWPEPNALTPNQLRQVRQSLPQQTADLVAPDIAQRLLEVIAAMAPKRIRSGRPFAVHIFVSRGPIPGSLESSLADAGFDVSWSYSADECARFCARSQPHLLMIRDSGDGPDICDLILGLSLRGVAVDHIPTILLVEAEAVDEALRLIKHGLEDVFNAAMNTDVLVAKLLRLRKRADEKAQSRLEVLRELGTHGSLEDMSLIELLESTRSNPRPVQLNLSAAGRQLTLWVDKGNIIRAECDEALGIEAILQGIGWRQGVWNIDAVDQSLLPEPNVNKKIDAVLLEACTIYDASAAR